MAYAIHPPALMHPFCQYVIFLLFRVCLFFLQGANFTNPRKIVSEIDGNSDRCMSESPVVRLHSLVKRHNWKDNKAK